MKTRSLALVLAFCLMASMLVAPPDASAALGWYECTIFMINRSADGSTGLQLTHTGGSFTTKWFTIPATQSNQYMAVVLTAISTNKNVVIYTDLAQPVSYPDIVTLYLYNN